MTHRVAIQFAVDHGSRGVRTLRGGEQTARDVVERFGHAVDVEVEPDGLSLLVTTATQRGDGGAFRLHSMACNAGLLACVR